MAALKLNLGCGDNLLEGFVNIDKYDPKADVMADVCYLPYEDNSVDEIVAYQVIEHLPYWQTNYMSNEYGLNLEPLFFQECYRVLKPGGKMVTECPDIEFIAKRIAESGEITYNDIQNLYGEYYRPWDKHRYDDWENVAAGIHTTAYTFKNIQKIAEHCGFSSVRKNTMAEKHSDYKYEENLSVKWTK